MNREYKKLFDSHFNKPINLCSWDICNTPVNLLQYFYTCIVVK